jgi:DNA-binding transcriptional ArsR family regulator
MRMCSYSSRMKRTSRDEVFRLHAQFCKALGDGNRLLLIVELRDGPRTVTDLAKAIGASQSLTSRHLAVLREKGLVVARRDGTFVRYGLVDRRILSAIDLLLDVLAMQLEKQASHSSVVRRIRPAARAS